MGPGTSSTTLQILVQESGYRGDGDKTHTGRILPGNYVQPPNELALRLKA